MPLCAHPDLPGQVADLINPEAFPGWEPIEPPAESDPTPEPRDSAAETEE
ncbi:MAG: hypothetical protein IPI13_17440 [Actinomycetales bacterium]|jgi:hypothetical protein|uniref:Uncharacterized protein n=1 Tax=Candidatus Phosphoribacter hodrii TaxID=2953743 RepID=A0A935MJ61_9MICO|nr:hypothetical protein [Candidatus Phosphoribacter hodrii]